MENHPEGDKVHRYADMQSPQISWDMVVGRGRTSLMVPQVSGWVTGWLQVALSKVENTEGGWLLGERHPGLGHGGYEPPVEHSEGISR